MDEPVFCPKCEGTEHEHSMTNPRIHHSLVRAADCLVNLWKHLHFGFIIIKHNGSDEDYVPESYRCKACGHRFLSGKTYDGMVGDSREPRKKCLFWGLLALAASVFLALAILLDVLGGFTDENSIWLCALLLIVPLTLACILLGGAYFSAKETIALLEESAEFQNVQSKHAKAVTSQSEDYIPAWKRIQTTQQN